MLGEARNINTNLSFPPTPQRVPPAQPLSTSCHSSFITALTEMGAAKSETLLRPQSNQSFPTALLTFKVQTPILLRYVLPMRTAPWSGKHRKKNCLKNIRRIEMLPSQPSGRRCQTLSKRFNNITTQAAFTVFFFVLKWRRGATKKKKPTAFFSSSAFESDRKNNKNFALLLLPRLPPQYYYYYYVPLYHRYI